MGADSILTTKHQFYYKGHQTGKAILGTPLRLPHKCAKSIFRGLLFWLFHLPSRLFQFLYPCLIHETSKAGSPVIILPFYYLDGGHCGLYNYHPPQVKVSLQSHFGLASNYHISSTWMHIVE